MSGDDQSTESLKRRQLDEERLEREQVAGAATDADAARHRRRAEKAGYLRRKLEQRERAEHDRDDEPEPPSAA
jgi:hypothetical protein